MAQGDTQISLVGNLVADPELRYTPNGAAVANFRVASTPRRYDQQSGQYVDGEGLFLTCNVWRQAAENVANSLKKGDRVLVVGRLRQRSYESRNGEQRTVFEVEVDDVGPALRYATAQVQRNAPAGGGRGGSGYGSNSGSGSQGASQQGYANHDGGQGNQGMQGNQGGQGFGGHNAARDDDPWNSAPEAGFGAGDDEPPF